MARETRLDEAARSELAESLTKAVLDGRGPRLRRQAIEESRAELEDECGIDGVHHAITIHVRAAGVGHRSDEARSTSVRPANNADGLWRFEDHGAYTSR